jgi:hypothetical protein
MDCPMTSLRRLYRTVGDPVDVVTGANTDISLDFRLAGPLPLYWSRHYNSTQNNFLRPLGWGHTHGFDCRLQIESGQILYTKPTGETFSFPLLSRDGESVASDGVILRRLAPRVYHINEERQPTLEFEFY